MAAGVWVTIDHSTFNFLTFFDDPDLQKVAYAMIVVGGFVTLLGFVGCFGACHERKWMIWLVRWWWLGRHGNTKDVIGFVTGCGLMG